MSDFWEERGKLDGILSVEPCADEADRKKEEKFRRQLLAWTTTLMQREQLLPANHLLDLGCGFGDIAAHLAPHCAKITMVDGSSSMIEQARATMGRTSHPSWTGAQSDLATFDAIDADVDLVYLGAVCMYLTEDEYAGLIARIAASGSRTVTIVQREYVAMNGGWTGTTEKGDYRSYRRAAGTYLELAARAGFTCSLLRYSSDMDIDRALRALGPVGRGLASVIRPIGRVARRGKKEGSSTFVLRRTR
ncbi:MAG: class I SAM-dependent methyltransferase [Proteobacteria bacterium]|nr:class I SAM-dependent methyltransferase [Pseudomonadota bacterium]